MNHIFYLSLLFQIITCNYKTQKPSGLVNSELNLNQNSTTEYLINSVDKNLVGKKIVDTKKIKLLKEILISSYEREFERPYMWDIFVSSNDNLLEFYPYKKFRINGIDIVSYYIKIKYEDGLYESIILINENLNIEYNAMIVYEKLDSEEKYSKQTKVSGDKVILTFKKPTYTKNMVFQFTNGIFLDYFDVPNVNKKWKDKGISSLEYQQKGKTKNHRKEGYWIEKKYSIKYNKTIIEDGNYKNGLKDGEWNYSPEGPVDMIKIFNNGKVIKVSYP
ncbi:MAG: hypothetical protein QM535_06550 [Limnohabitans sp.]|nr:hypothetical protein [Limnohabitans sp.]